MGKHGWLYAGLAALMSGLFIIAACGGSETSTLTPVKPTATATAPSATATKAPLTATPSPAPTATPAAPQPKVGGTLRAELIGPFTTMDVQANRGTQRGVTVPLMNYLLAPRANYFQGNTPGLYPDLALSWDTSTDGKTYTFKLTPDAKWHDGVLVTAQDVIFSFNRIASDPGIPAAPFRATFKSVDKMEAPDPLTLRITLKQISASFLPQLTAMNQAIYPEHAVQSILDMKPVGSGPFRFVSYDRDQKAVIERNPNYWKKDPQGRALPYLDRMELYILPNSATRIAAFRTGQVDLMDNVTQVSGTDFDQIKAAYSDTVSVPNRGGFLYWLFPNRAPYNDVRVRKAFSLAFDRQQWDTLMNEGMGNPFILDMNTDSAFEVPPTEVSTWPGYRQPKGTDIADAKSLLQTAGFTQQLITVTVQMYSDQAVAAAGILRANLGIDTKFVQRDLATFTQDQKNQNFEILYDSNAPAIDDPSAIFPGWYMSGGTNNWGKWSDPQLDQQINALETTLDATARLKVTQDIQRRINQELFWTVNHGSLFRRYLSRGYIRGWNPKYGAADVVQLRHETTWLEKTN